jgi:hypothetical protein
VHEEFLFVPAHDDFLRCNLLDDKERHVQAPLAIHYGHLIIEQCCAVCRTENKPLQSAFRQCAFTAYRLIAGIAADVKLVGIPSVRRVGRKRFGIVETE